VAQEKDALDLELERGTPQYESVPSSAELDAFYEDIQNQAHALYLQHEAELSGISITAWDKAVKRAIFRCKQMGIGMRLLAEFTRPAQKTFVATNVLSTLVLPPILTALGLGPLGLTILATPFEPVVAAAQIALGMAIEEAKLVKMLGTDDYIEVKKIRKKILSMSERGHVISLIESDLRGSVPTNHEAWLSVTQTRMLTKHPSISTGELEELVRQDSNGSEWLENSFMSQLDQGNYVRELWSYIKEHPALIENFNNRYSYLLNAPNRNFIDVRISRKLFLLKELKKTLAKLSNEISEETKKQLSRSSKVEKAEYKKLLKELSDHDSDLKKAANAIEAQVLLARVYNIERFVSLDQPIEAITKRIQDLKSLQSQLYRIEQDRFFSPSEFAKILESESRNPTSAERTQMTDSLTKKRELVEELYKELIASIQSQSTHLSAQEQKEYQQVLVALKKKLEKLTQGSDPLLKMAHLTQKTSFTASETNRLKRAIDIIDRNIQLTHKALEKSKEIANDRLLTSATFIRDLKLQPFLNSSDNSIAKIDLIGEQVISTSATRCNEVVGNLKN